MAAGILAGVTGFLVGITLILIGLTRMGHAGKILNPPDKKVEPEALPAQSESTNSALPRAPITEELRESLTTPPSVVENTTIRLKR